MSKTTTLMRQRYRPVSEFDEVTLASKREYWRTKKREQRARLSKAKKKVKAPNTGIRKPACTDGHVSHMSHCEFSPTLLNSDGSYQTSVAQTQTKRMVICKKEMKSLTTEESNMDASVIKCNGAPLTKVLPVPGIKVHPNSITPRQTLNRSLAFNSNNSSISQISAASQLASKCSKQAPQLRSCITPKSLALMECKFDKDQCILPRSGTNTNRNAGASGPVCSMVVCKTTEVAMTVEEKLAKRRENWRVKKREQRAKRAEKLKMDGEKLHGFEKGQQEKGKLSCAAPAHSLSAVNTMALRGAKQRNSVMSVDSRMNAGKPLHYGVRVERDKLSPQRPYKPQSVVLKPQSVVLAERQRLLAKNLSSDSVYSTNQFRDPKQNHMALSSGFSMQHLRPSQAIGQSKMMQQKFVRIQRRVLPQGNETAEEQLAKQREYWRIKKREQRAKRSLALKGRLKDRDAFNWRSKRYQSIMEQMRRTPLGLQKMPHPNKNTLLNTSNPISNFMKVHGTGTTGPILQTTAEKCPPVISCSLSAVKSSESSGPPMLQRLIRTRARPGLNRIPNNTNLSATQRRTLRSTGQHIPAFDPVVGSKLEDVTIRKSSTEATQTEELIAENRTTCKTELKSCDSCSVVTPDLVSTSCDATKQEPIYPSIAMVCSLTEQSQTMNIKAIKPAPSSPVNSVEVETCLNSDSQSTTLLVVASMKKLLEESLSSVGDSNSSSIDKDELLPCKTEHKPFLQEEKETDRKPDLTTPQEFSADTSSVVVKQSPSPCHSSLQAHDFSSDGTVLSCQDSSLQLPCTAPCFSKGPGDERCELPVAVCVSPLHRGNSVQKAKGKSSGPQRNFRAQNRGGQQLNENTELQRKREYWRVMKRQQRARKAKEMERGKDALHPSQRKCGTFQIIHPPVAQKMNYTNLNNPVIPPSVPSRPARPVLSPTASSNQQPSNESRQLLYEGQKGKTKFPEVSQVNKWQLHVQGKVPTSNTRPGTVTAMPMNHAKLSDPRLQTRGSSLTKLKNTHSQLKITANQELDPDDIVQKKRMLWRIKKQEQRARKAARERELSHQATLSQTRHSWSNNNTHVVQSILPERPDYMTEECETTSVKDEAEVCYLPDDDCLAEPLSEDMWRSTYLMDYDPVTQLLVCMVCGEQQYTFSAEGVRAHIEETHPGTLSLEEAERQRILEAWDEQVAVRERFFSNQLWQNSDVLKANEQSSGHTAEVEVILGQDEKADQSK